MIRAIKGVVYINPNVRNEFGCAYEKEMGTALLNAVQSEQYVGKDGRTRLSKEGRSLLEFWYKGMGENPGAYMMLRVRDYSTGEWSYTKVNVRR